MKLPNLPKLRNKTEADITPKIMDWFLKNCPFDVAVEVKIVGGKVRPHQKSALKQVHDGKFAHKLADTGIRQPFDFIVLKNAHPFIVRYNPKTKRCVACNHKNEEFFEIYL